MLHGEGISQQAPWGIHRDGVSPLHGDRCASLPHSTDPGGRQHKYIPQGRKTSPRISLQALPGQELFEDSQHSHPVRSSFSVHI